MPFIFLWAGMAQNPEMDLPGLRIHPPELLIHPVWGNRYFPSAQGKQVDSLEMLEKWPGKQLRHWLAPRIAEELHMAPPRVDSSKGPKPVE